MGLRGMELYLQFRHIDDLKPPPFDLDETSLRRTAGEIDNAMCSGSWKLAMFPWPGSKERS
jgi:hypothetical protein